MLETPKEVLGEGYPLPTEKARKETAPIWERAFEIHATAHTSDARYGAGHLLPVRPGPDDVIYPNSTPYCDCYMRAWLEFHDPAEIERAKRKKRRQELRALVEKKREETRLFYAQPEFYEREV